MTTSVLKQVATLGPVGHTKRAPGTYGTLATLPLIVAASYLGPFVYMAVTILLIPVAILAASAYESGTGNHDQKEIVIDEVVGFFITMIWLPITWQSLLIGFALFRFLDIWKPFPINYLDKKIQGGLGVVIDDVAAGLVASLILQYLYTHTSWLGAQLVVIGG